MHRWRGRWYLFATFHDEKAALSATHGGPFTLVRQGAPIAEADRMTLDGTLHVDPVGKPWLVYAHEWVQVGTGTIGAVPLDDGLKAAGASRTLFRASDALWSPGSPQGDGTTI